MTDDQSDLENWLFVKERAVDSPLLVYSCVAGDWLAGVSGDWWHEDGPVLPMYRWKHCLFWVALGTTRLFLKNPVVYRLRDDVFMVES